MLGRFPDALPDLSKSLELEPKSAETWYFRAFCFEKTRNPDNALQDYSKAIDLNPNYVEALVNRGLMYYNRQKTAESIADNSAALLICAAELKPMVLVNRANAFLQAGKLAEALSDASQALAINPNYPRAYQTRASIYQQLGQYELAKADLLQIK